MTITVGLFGPLREAAGQDAIELDWRSNMTVAQVKVDALEQIKERLGKAPSQVFLASEQAILQDEEPVADGDRVYLMPPFGGG